MAFGIVVVCTTDDTPRIRLSAGKFKKSLALVISIKTHNSVDDYPSLFSLALTTRLGYPFFKKPPHTFTHPPSLTRILIYVSNTSSSSSSNTTSNPSTSNLARYKIRLTFPHPLRLVRARTLHSSCCYAFSMLGCRSLVVARRRWGVALLRGC